MISSPVRSIAHSDIFRGREWNPICSTRWKKKKIKFRGVNEYNTKWNPEKSGVEVSSFRFYAKYLRKKTKLLLACCWVLQYVRPAFAITCVLPTLFHDEQQKNDNKHCCSGNIVSQKLSFKQITRLSFQNNVHLENRCLFQLRYFSIGRVKKW